jgi:glyoxylase-like metal-dependent hydrolase (beta-lactamase superfamily II)
MSGAGATAIRPTSQEQWEAWRAKVLPPVEQVRAGLWSIPVPMPNNPLRYSLSYALSVHGGLVLFDPGWPSASCFHALSQGIQHIGYSVKDVVGILITHAHPDHLGLAARLREESGAWIGMHRAEADLIASTRAPDVDVGQLRERHMRAMVASGAPCDDAKRTVASMHSLSWVPQRPIPDRVFEDGDLVVAERSVSAVWTPGHSPGHCCYHLEEDGVLITGDHLLPRVSPNITARAWEPESPLEDFMASLGKIAGLVATEVLPGHEFRFFDHGVRVEQLRRHHSARLDELESVLRLCGTATTWDLARQLQWARPWDDLEPRQWSFALGETLSHLRYLRTTQRVALLEGTDAQSWRAGD